MDCPTCKLPAIPKTFYECEGGHSWWVPNPGPQTRFLTCRANEVLYGGAAGGGKSAALTMLPLRWHEHRSFKSLILRRETSQLEEMVDLAKIWYRVADERMHGASKGGSYHFTFSSGAKIQFNHCKDVSDAFNYQGKQFQVIGFDELTHFEWVQYQELKSRVRGAHQGLPRYLRATSNPGGPGHEWVMKRWGPWLDPDFEAEGIVRRYLDEYEVDENGKRVLVRRPIPAFESGQIAWIERRGSEDVYLAKRPAIIDPAIHGSRTFIGAKLSDNRVLTTNDPGYERNLNDLDIVRREQLKSGNWLIRPAKGLYFKRAWWRLCEVAPSGGVRLRYWDRAASEDPTADWTVGVRMIRLGDLYWVDDVVRMRGSPGEVEQTILATAELDGKSTMQVLELDPGSAGKSEAFQYSKLLAGFNVRFRRPSGDKVTRASTFSAQVEAQNVHLLKGRRWLEPYIQELEGFPEDTHDDQVDASSGAFNTLLVLGGGSSKASGGHRRTPEQTDIPLG